MRQVTMTDIEKAIAACPRLMPIGDRHHLYGWIRGVLIIVTRNAENDWSVELRAQ
jgi:hypothetical protein